MYNKIQKKIAVVAILGVALIFVSGCTKTKESKLESVFPDEQQTEKSVAKVQEMKGLIATKYSKQPNEVSVMIGTERGDNFVRGSYDFVDGSKSGRFLGVLLNGQWKLAHEAVNEVVIPCSAVQEYNFPADMIVDCK